MIKFILAMQFVLELQWLLLLAFSPMQLDFESAPFSHLGTSPLIVTLYQYKLEKSRFLLRKRQYYAKVKQRRDPK